MSTTPELVYKMTPEQIEDMINLALDKSEKNKAVKDRLGLLASIEYLTANQGAKIIGVTVETFRRYVREGRIKSTNRTETERFHITELEKFIGRNGTKQTVGKPT